MFISHTGEVFPSGFLPLSAGNILWEPMTEIYQNAPLFRALRDSSQLKGKCARCEFKAEDRGHAPSRSATIRWRKNLAAPTCRAADAPPPWLARDSVPHLQQEPHSV